MLKIRPSFSFLLVAGLVLFSIINPYTSLDLAAVILIAFILAQKMFGDYAVIILLTLRPTLDYWRDYNLITVQGLNININAGISLLLLGWSLIFFYQNKNYLTRLPLRWLWLLFLAWIACSLGWSYDLPSTIQETLKAANLFALFGISYILYKKNTAKFPQQLLLAFWIAAIAPLGLTLYQFFTQTGMRIDEIGNRLYGTFAHPNILATFALLLFMTLSEKLLATKEKKIGWSLGFLAVIIALTYTRIAWIGLAFFVSGLLFFYQRKLFFQLAISAAVLYGLFFPFNSWLIHNYNYDLQHYQIISRLTKRNEDVDSIKWRADLADKVLPLFWRHPLIGYGYGTFAQVWEDNKAISNLWDNTSEAHNDYLKVGFESGIIGLVLFLSLFVGLLIKQINFGIKNHWKNLVFILSIIVYLILSASDNMLHHTPTIWWLWAMWGLWSAQNE